MTKEKWYMTTGRESGETKRKAAKVMFGDTGYIHRNSGWCWVSEFTRTKQRMLTHEVNSGTIVAYTFGEWYEYNQTN